MLLTSSWLRAVFSVAFGALVGLSSGMTGTSLAWAVPLGIVTTVIAYAAQTLYVKRSQRHGG